MATDLETLVVRLEAQMKGYEREMNRARGITDRNMRAIEKSASTSSQKFTAIMANAGRTAASGMMTGLAVLGAGGLVAGLGFSALVDTAKAAAAELAKIGDVAGRVGVTAEALQALQFASEQNAGSVEAVNSGLTRFAAGLADASAKGGDLYKILQANNVAFQDSAGKLLPTQQVLERYADLVKNARTPAEALELAIRGFGRAAGPELVGMLSQGSAGLREMMQQAKDAGAVLDNDLIAKAQEIDDKFAAISRTVGQQVKGAIVSAAAALGDFAAALGKVENYRIKLGVADAVVPEQAMRDERIRQINGVLGRTGGKTSVAKTLNEEREALIELNKQYALSKLPAPADRAKEPSAPSLVGQAPPKPTILPAAGDGGGGAESKARKAAERLVESYNQMILVGQQRIDSLKVEQQALGLTTAEAEKLRFEQDLLNEAQRDGVVLTDDQRAKITELATTYGVLTASVETAKEAQKAAQEVMQDFQNIASGGAKGFASDLMAGVSAAKSLENALGRVAERLIDMALDQAISGLFSNLGSGGANPFAKILGGLGGGRASGGPVQSGKTYLVGENGPEMVRFGRNGTVVPNSVVQSGGGGGSTVVNIANYSGESVQQKKTKTAGGERVDVVIGKMVAQQMSTPGTPANKAVRTFGGGMPLTRR